MRAALEKDYHHKYCRFCRFRLPREVRKQRGDRKRPGHSRKRQSAWILRAAGSENERVSRVVSRCGRRRTKRTLLSFL